MLVVLSDTHARTDPHLSGALLEAVRAADLLCHCGDFNREPVLAAFEAEATDFAAVYGNTDAAAIRERLPATRVVAYEGARIAMAHGHEHTRTSLALFGRQSNADLVLVGHSHRPAFEYLGEVPVLNPGSHARPRGNRPGYATLEVRNDALVGEVREPGGPRLEAIEVGLD
jgi:putative phosphoesterase